MSRFVRFCWTLCLLSVMIYGSSCRAKYTNVSVGGTLTTLDSTFYQDSTALALIEPYKNILDIEMNEIIAYSDIDITKNQPEGLLNNFICDLLLYMCNTYYADNNVKYDVAIFNNGGLRSAIPKGLVTVGDVYRLMPFENEAVIITISADEFLEMVNYIISTGGIPFSGMRIVSRQKILDTLTVNGLTFDESRNYRVVTSDYLALGGDKMAFFNNPVEYKSLSVMIRDLIIEYLREQNKLGVSLHPELDGRIRYE